MQPISRRLEVIKLGNGELGLRFPSAMVKELDIKKGDYVLPCYDERKDGSKDDEFGNLKLHFIFYRNKSGKKFNPYIELESDRDV